MAREIVVARGGEESHFAFRKISRSMLYGRRKRVPLDPAGERCERASLSEDGALLLRKGMLAQGYFDSMGTWVPDRELVPVDEEGEELPMQDSTLGAPQEAEGPLEASAVLDLRVQSVYALEESGVDEALVAALRAGEIYRVPFVYRAGPGGGRRRAFGQRRGRALRLGGDPDDARVAEPRGAHSELRGERRRRRRRPRPRL